VSLRGGTYHVAVWQLLDENGGWSGWYHVVVVLPSGICCLMEVGVLRAQEVSWMKTTAMCVCGF
jgi:hypothetical protein